MPKRRMRSKVQVYLKVSSDEKHPLYDKIGREITSRLKRPRMVNQAYIMAISECSDVQNIRRGAI